MSSSKGIRDATGTDFGSSFMAAGSLCHHAETFSSMA
jgi:hypothetical protein